jgi:hypothetical protein
MRQKHSSDIEENFIAVRRSVERGILYKFFLSLFAFARFIEMEIQFFRWEHCLLPSFFSCCRSQLSGLV